MQGLKRDQNSYVTSFQLLDMVLMRVLAYNYCAYVVVTHIRPHIIFSPTVPTLTIIYSARVTNYLYTPPRRVQLRVFVEVMDVVWDTLSFLAVALVWGITNPLLKKGSVGIENIQQRGRLRQLFWEFTFLALQWQYAVPFVINQSGSVLYYVTIGQADISLAVPITNSLTFLVTSIAGRMMGEKAPTNVTYFGVVLVLIGVSLCIGSKVYT